MELLSTAFKDRGAMPRTYTCDGINVSPPIRWKDLPAGTRSLALVCDDPDAPGGRFVHWILFNIPSNVDHLDEDVGHTEFLPIGAVHGKNDFGKLGYRGPCPPDGLHNYHFELFALDTLLEKRPGIDRDTLEAEMDGHILDTCTLIGNYRRTTMPVT